LYLSFQILYFDEQKTTYSWNNENPPRAKNINMPKKLTDTTFCSPKSLC
jgi:hypothetical protein